MLINTNVPEQLLAKHRNGQSLKRSYFLHSHLHTNMRFPPQHSSSEPPWGKIQA